MAHAPLPLVRPDPRAGRGEGDAVLGLPPLRRALPLPRAAGAPLPRALRPAAEVGHRRGGMAGRAPLPPLHRPPAPGACAGPRQGLVPGRLRALPRGVVRSGRTRGGPRDPVAAPPRSDDRREGVRTDLRSARRVRGPRRSGVPRRGRGGPALRRLRPAGSLGGNSPHPVVGRGPARGGHRRGGGRGPRRRGRTDGGPVGPRPLRPVPPRGGSSS